MRIALLVATLSLALAGCAEPFHAQVSRFQTLPASPGQTYTIRAGAPQLVNSLEFAHYADLVAAKLNAQGYQPAANPDAATLVVNLDYGVDKGKTVTRVDPFPYAAYGGGFGYGYGFHRRYRGFYGGYGFGYDPFFFGPAYADVDTYTVYTSGLDMNIDRKADGQRLFEGHAKAISTTDALTTLVPNLIDAMFTNFPGKSGETVKITVAPPKKS